MQETLFKQWQDLNQISLDWYRDTSESQAAAINDWMGLQSNPGAWAKPPSPRWSPSGPGPISVNPRSATCGRQIGKLIPTAGRFAKGAGRHPDEPLHGARQDPGRHLEPLHRYHRAVPRFLEAGEKRRGPDRHPGPRRYRRPGQAQDLLPGLLADRRIRQVGPAAWAEKAVDTAAAQDEKAAPVSAPRRTTKKTDASA